jgi:hypothetical protein
VDLDRLDRLMIYVVHWAKVDRVDRVLGCDLVVASNTYNREISSVLLWDKLLNW